MAAECTCHPSVGSGYPRRDQLGPHHLGPCPRYREVPTDPCGCKKSAEHTCGKPAWWGRGV